MEIKDFVTAVEYNLGDAAEFMWECYGNKACILCWEKTDGSGSAVMVYDYKNQTVYEIAVWDDLSDKVYRWIRPEYLKRHKSEAKKKGFKFNVAYDNVKYEEVTPATILKKIKRLYDRKPT